MIKADFVLADVLTTPLEDICEKNSVDLIVTSPPYKTQDGWSEPLMERLGELATWSLKPGGRLMMNFAQLTANFDRPYESRRLVKRAGLYVGQTIIWVKSAVFDGSVQRGHYTPINSPRILNYGFEFIFTFYVHPETELDRLAIGVPFADKGNLDRGERGKNGDLHCAGDVWVTRTPGEEILDIDNEVWTAFYSTTGADAKKPTAGVAGSYAFPEAIPERCIKVAKLPAGAVVMDPFVGSGTTCIVAKRLGFDSIGIDRNEALLVRAEQAWEAS